MSITAKILDTNAKAYPLHIATESGKVKKLERLLNDGQALEPDSNGRTPLHFACEFAYQDTSLRMVGVILKSLRDETATGWKRFKNMFLVLNIRDNLGETALHIAAKIGHRDVVKQLLLHGADQHIGDKMLRTPLDLIYCNMPTAIIPNLDASIKSNGRDLYDDKLQLTFDFSSIIGRGDSEVNFLHRETKTLANCLRQDVEKRSEILSHPVVQTFIHLKWSKIKRILFLSMIFHSFWLILYTIIICQLYLFQCPGQRIQAIQRYLNATAFAQVFLHQNGLSEARSMSSATAYGPTSGPEIPGLGNHQSQPKREEEIHINSPQSGIACDLGPGLAAIYILECIVLFGCTVVVILKKGYQFYVSPSKKYYFSKMDNIGQLILLCLMPFTFITAFTMKDNLIKFTGPVQYVPEVLGILIAWSLILKQLGKFSTLGIYVEILGNILKRFVGYLHLFAPLLLAFAISFLILMPQNEEFEYPWVFLKVFVMMTGEVEYRETFYPEKNNPSKVPFATFTKLIYALFLGVVTMVFFNLLIGLTVSDIQDLQRQAKFNELARKLEQMDNTERIIFSKTVQKFGIGHLLKYFVVAQLLPDGKTNLQVDVSIKEIPSDVRHSVRELAVPNLTVPDSESDDDDDEANCGSEACDLHLVRHPSKKLLHRFTFRNYKNDCNNIL